MVMTIGQHQIRSYMNKWDKYKKQKWTREDEFYAWSKIAMIFLAGYIYFHFVVMGW